MYQGQGPFEVKLSGKHWFSLCGSPWNQTWVKDVIGVPLYVNEVKGHIPKSKVT